MPVLAGRQLLSKQLCLRKGIMLCDDRSRLDLCWSHRILCLPFLSWWRLLPSRFAIPFAKLCIKCIIGSLLSRAPTNTLSCLHPGLLCGANQACTPPAGVTFSQTCPGTGYTACPASLQGGCCQSGMACGMSACYNTSPSTSVMVVATTRDGSATTITSTSVFTPTAEPSDAATGVVAKLFPSTYSKQAATEGDSSPGGGGSSGLSKGAIGGIVGGAAAVLVIFLAVACFLVKRLNKTKRAVESHRETTSGSGTRQTAEKKSETQVSVVRMQPTPSEVDAMDCDPLMVPSSSIASPQGRYQNAQPVNGRSRSGSDTLSQPSGYSDSTAGPRWNTPSADGGGDSNSREYFSIPPGAQLAGRRASEASSQYRQYSYHRFVHGGRHGRNHSDASELSAGSDSEIGSQHGRGSPHMGAAAAAELSNEGGFVPELPGSDTETESNGPHGANGRRPGQPRRRSTGVVSPMSTTSVNKPPLTHANLVSARRRGNSNVSPMDAQNGGGGRGRSDSSVATESRLGSIDESAMAAVPATNSLHGYFGSPTAAVGQTAAGRRDDFDTPPLPGFVSLGPPLGGPQPDQGQGGR
jgi:hypothetical protein